MYQKVRRVLSLALCFVFLAVSAAGCSDSSGATSVPAAGDTQPAASPAPAEPIRSAFPSR
jgi:hypothetical protein